jgi:hypothetical protein
MDHGDTQPPREDLGELIEDLIKAESSLLSAQAVMLDSSLAHRSGYESIGAHQRSFGSGSDGAGRASPHVSRVVVALFSKLVRGTRL